MKSPSLQRSAALSAGLHLIFFLLAFLVMRQSSSMVMPSPYVVSLVSPGRTAPKTYEAPSVTPARTAEKPARQPVVEKVDKKARQPAAEKKAETVKPDRNTRELVEDSIAAIRAKKKIREKQNQFGRIRKEIAAIRAAGEKGTTKSPSHAATAAQGEGAGEGSYIDRVASEIHNEWQWPDYMKKDLEAVISIRILRDGTIAQMKFEKKSGDRLFDRSVAQAIAKASPVTPPPYEMEIGVRFYP